ncbi:MAG: outer membrane protein assembly factor BamE [Ideonella sp.]|jgi:outer membrane protein assembly factor BamE|nr:outer membrane protein assembly factor BamE [Ideonella sp.]
MISRLQTPPANPSGRPRRAVSAGLAFALVLTATLLGGCASLQRSDSLVSALTPYRMEIVQGNVVTREQAALVRPGMTRAQVRDVLGSPLLASAFHADRWDYVFTIRRQGAEPQVRRVLVRFEGDRLASIDTGGELPGEREFVASIDPTRPARTPPSLALTDEQLAALPRPAPAAPAVPAEPPSAPRAFPPLEPR